MAKPRDWIKRALRLVQALASGETPPAEEVNDALSVLNGMLDSWSNDKLLIPSEQREEFDLVAGVGAYSFGMGGDFNSARPLSIERFGIISGGIETPIEEINLDQWAMINVKTTQGQPSKVYLTGSSPYETVKVWPVPDQALKLAVYSKKPLERISSVNSEINLPQGYEDAIVYNLAKRLAPEYGKELAASAMQIAASSLLRVKGMNIKPIFAESDAPCTGGGRLNIYTGRYE